jgi:hypothetical protein
MNGVSNLVYVYTLCIYSDVGLIIILIYRGENRDGEGIVVSEFFHLFNLFLYGADRLTIEKEMMGGGNKHGFNQKERGERRI